MSFYEVKKRQNYWNYLKLTKIQSIESWQLQWSLAFEPWSTLFLVYLWNVTPSTLISGRIRKTRDHHTRKPRKGGKVIAKIFLENFEFLIRLERLHCNNTKNSFKITFILWSLLCRFANLKALNAKPKAKSIQENDRQWITHKYCHRNQF